MDVPLITTTSIDDSSISTSESTVPTIGTSDMSLFEIAMKYLSNVDKLKDANISGIALSGFIVVFLLIAFIFRSSVANRVSLRLIWLASLFYCLDTIIITFTPLTNFSACIASTFFANFFEFAGIYLTASIVMNLQLKFLRSSTRPLSKYASFLYFFVPLLIATLHLVPQYIYSAAKGMCTFADAYQPETTKYVVYNVFAVIIIPGIFIMYSALTSFTIIIALIRRRRAVSSAIKVSLSKVSEQQTDPVVLKEIVQLHAIRSVYSGAIRIALYPFAPLVWLALRCAELGLKNNVPETSSDANRLLSGTYVGTVVMPVFIFAGFVLFLFDPIFCQLFSKNKNADSVQIEKLASGTGAVGNIDEVAAAETNEAHADLVASLKIDSVTAYVKDHNDAKEFLKTL
ncbi:hypothetical protein LPJ53_005689 [Coemansia erecta]|uniref:Uncharacterized protein n=1 Tax=Coemansia erecta TaxID=147472 RepID=A0A9W7XV59_9FUNG|nr:hypothetical protein LPJ53_005689 [Coemansia erecta]